ncbi:MAG: glycosyltransferase [Lachnospiraceae bacterium]|nr:glycosyltransferase [Lachnospiraceae bacterium]
MSKVSICIPTYNNLDQVMHLISSINEQTYQDIEIIITDDSTNSEIADWIGKQETIKKLPCLQKCRYQHNKKPLGHIFNWNEALKLAKGEYIKIMFSDDWFTYKDSLEKFIKLLEDKPEAALAFCGSMQVSEKDSYARCAGEEFIAGFTKDYRHLITGDEIGAPSAVIYRACDCYFDERSTFASDVFLFMRILKKNSSFAYTTEPLVSIGVHDNQYTCDFKEIDSRKLADYEILYREYQAWENKECREFFVRQFVFPYKLGWKYAKSMHISFAEYWKRAVQILKWNLTKGYPHALKKRLGRL